MASRRIQRELAKLSDTVALGHRLGELLFPAAVVALVGPLGAGKTHLARAIAEGLGVADGRVVTSPTFVLLQEYQGRLPIYHSDAYRLHSAAEFADLGAMEDFEDGVCLIEWADKIPQCLPSAHLRVALTITGPTSRYATLDAQGNLYEAVLEVLGVPTGPAASS